MRCPLGKWAAWIQAATQQSGHHSSKSRGLPSCAPSPISVGEAAAREVRIVEGCGQRREVPIFRAAQDLPLHGAVVEGDEIPGHGQQLFLRAGTVRPRQHLFREHGRAQAASGTAWHLLEGAKRASPWWAKGQGRPESTPHFPLPTANVPPYRGGRSHLPGLGAERVVQNGARLPVLDPGIAGRVGGALSWQAVGRGEEREGGKIGTERFPPK